MSYRGIKRVLGESSLERKILVLLGICMLLLIAGSFLWVNQITEDLIYLNTRDQARSLQSDFFLRTHLKNIEGFDNLTGPDSERGNWDAAKVFELIATLPSSVSYRADVITLDGAVGRNQMPKLYVTKDSEEVELLTEILEETHQLQQHQNTLETLKIVFREEYEKIVADSPDDQNSVEAGALDVNQQDQRNALAALKILDPQQYEQKLAAQAAAAKKTEPDEALERYFSTRQRYFYYAPVIFKSNSECLNCHFPVARDPASQPRLNEIARQLGEQENSDAEESRLNLEKYSLAPPMFLRITLDNEITQAAITKSRAILISVAVVTAVLSVAMLWLVVRYVIVKPLAHLRDVTEDVSHGRLDVRAEINTGDEFEELSRSFNRMLRHLLDTQKELQTANQDLDNKVDEQAQLTLKLYEMNRVKSEFLANMSHELRTPLNSIIGFSEILETAKGLDEKKVRFASNIRNSGRLLLELINDILDLAKLEAGKMEVKPSEFSVTALVEELCEMVRNLAETKSIKLNCQSDQDLPDLLQDKIKVRQIVTNLVSNAIKFTPEGGRINVVVKRIDDGQQLRLEVHDTGVGIAESDQAIVFEKFRQGASAIGDDSLTREVSGTGLGLSIVKELCILLGGKIELESEVGKGSIFKVTIPWRYKLVPRINSEVSQAIDEINKSQRVNFARANLSPRPPQGTIDAGSSAATGGDIPVTPESTDSTSSASG